MEYLDQSFSSKNFRILYDLLFRKGKVCVAQISEEYERISQQIKDTFSQISKKELRKLKELKENELMNNLEKYAKEVNSHGFKFNMTKQILNNHEVFSIDASYLPSLFALNQIVYNLKRTFNVEMSSRHSIMTSLKKMLNTKMPINIIRTDVEGFFEHIPQDKLLEKLNHNNSLSFKTKSFIKQILNEFEALKDKNIIKPKLGVPRGISISSMLSEIYMQDLDRSIRSRKEVIFYARYVDDIFMVISPSSDIDSYYQNVLESFALYGLELKKKGTDKCQLLDINNFNNKRFDYLGYNLQMSYSKDDGLKTNYGLSSNKIKKMKERINNAFKHFEELCKDNLKQARRDLLDSLKLICGNYKLKNAKSRVKVGLYYNNDLLDKFDTMRSIGQTLKHKTIKIPNKVFKSLSEKNVFQDKLKKKIDGINLEQNWRDKRFYSFTIDRITEIMEWL